MALTIDNTLFEVNNGTYAGAVYVKGGEIKITDSNFTNNKAYKNNAGAVYIDELTSTFKPTNVEIDGCNFKSNSAKENGGAIYSLGGNVEIKDSLFDNNFALVGGAIDVIGHYGELVSIENCTFTNNFGFYGGAVYNGGGNIEISESLFYQ